MHGTYAPWFCVPLYRLPKCISVHKFPVRGFRSSKGSRNSFCSGAVQAASRRVSWNVRSQLRRFGPFRIIFGGYFVLHSAFQFANGHGVIDCLQIKMATQKLNTPKLNPPNLKTRDHIDVNIINIDINTDIEPNSASFQFQVLLQFPKGSLSQRSDLCPK